MGIKVSVIILLDGNSALENKCIESFKQQQLKDVELLCVESKKYKFGLEQASGELIIFARGNETADKELLKFAVRCEEESGADIVLLPVKRFDIETGYFSEADIWECCIEKKLFRREYIFNNFKSILDDDIIFGRYIGLSLLTRTDNVTAMSESRLYSTEDKKVSGEDILQNYTLLYKDLRTRNKWDEKKQQFSNWLLADIALWLDNSFFIEEEKKFFGKIHKELLARTDILDYEEEYYTSEQSRKGVYWIKGIIAGEHFAAKHNLDYKKLQIYPIKKFEGSTIPNISVIIPVYNVEKYVAETLDSLESQTFTNFEIICVDDGSTDCSLKILMEYADKDERISIYQQPNCGQSVARNRAIKYARGKYIYFMDSDDILHRTALEVLYNYCEENCLEIVYFDGGVVSDLPEEAPERKRFETYYKRVGKYGKIVYEGSELMREMYTKSEYRVSPCLQFIKKEHILSHEIYFHEGIIHEDNAFNFLCMIQAKRVGYYGINLFGRRVRVDSTMTKKGTFENVYGYLSCYIDIFNWLQNNDLPDSSYQTVCELLDRLIHSAKHQYSIMESYERVIINFLKPYERSLYKMLIDEKNEKN